MIAASLVFVMLGCASHGGYAACLLLAAGAFAALGLAVAPTSLAAAFNGDQIIAACAEPTAAPSLSGPSAPCPTCKTSLYDVEPLCWKCGRRR